MKPVVCAVLLVLVGLSPLFPQSALTLGAGDVAAEARADGYHLWVKQKPGLGSVMLTEAFEAPDHKLATYALRSAGPNPLLDGEQRLLNGKFLAPGHRSLITSTVTNVPGFGPAYHLVLPPQVEFGNASYPNSRYGQVDIPARLAAEGGTFWFSVRTFAKAYADYSGTYRDNAFELKAFLAQAPKPTQDHYEAGLWDDFARLGQPYKASGIDDAMDHIVQTLKRRSSSLDLVLAIDTTKSMADNLEAVKQRLLGPVAQVTAAVPSFRVGLVFYRDYLEDYLTRPVAFTSDLTQVQKALDKAQAAGGGDIPEAVVEALWTSVNSFSWEAQDRLVILLGDAPQHPAPRGDITEGALKDRARAQKVELQLILLPQTLP